jgi:hypothetical protein
MHGEKTFDEWYSKMKQAYFTVYKHMPQFHDWLHTFRQTIATPDPLFVNVDDLDIDLDE